MIERFYGKFSSNRQETLPKLNFHDNASEFRVEIVGRFAGGTVERVRRWWQNVLNEGGRPFVVDISQMVAYDSAGCALLRDLSRYGAKIVAATPESLVFLSEITGAVREQDRAGLRPKRPMCRIS